MLVRVKALEDDEPLVRGHAGWALGRLPSREHTPLGVVSAIKGEQSARLRAEEDEWVREELSLALGR